MPFAACAHTQTPAFPGAQGYGAIAVGGRGGALIEVTNLADSGPGSLRAALKAEGPRMVVFRVGGVIELKSTIRLTNSYLTVAGQTAPGGGVILRGADNNLLQIVGASDVVLRYLRLRNGSGVGDGDKYDNVTINSGKNIVVDHVSMSWSTDENLAIYRKTNHAPVENVTIQRSIMAEGLAGHSNGMLVGGTSDTRDADNQIEEWRKIKRLSVHHNLFAHNTHRNPRVTSAGAQIVNNVAYNWKHRIGSTTRGAVVDFVNNYFKSGPMSSVETLLLHEDFNPKRPFERYPEPSLYTSGNVIDPTNGDAAADNWHMHARNYVFTPLPESYRRHTPLPPAAVPLEVHSAREAFSSVLKDVGANARLDCKGRWVPTVDAVDLRLLTDTRNGTGPRQPVTAPDDVGGFPSLDTGTACADADHDGMPDEWEQLHGFAPNDPDDGLRDADADGYTNVEEYLNGTEPRMRES